MNGIAAVIYNAWLPFLSVSGGIFFKCIFSCGMTAYFFKILNVCVSIIYARKHAHAHTHTQKHTHTQAYVTHTKCTTHTDTHTYQYACTHSHTYARAHTRTYTPARTDSREIDGQTDRRRERDRVACMITREAPLNKSFRSHY